MNLLHCPSIILLGLSSCVPLFLFFFTWICYLQIESLSVTTHTDFGLVYVFADELTLTLRSPVALPPHTFSPVSLVSPLLPLPLPLPLPITFRPTTSFPLPPCPPLNQPPALKDDRFQMVLFTPRLVRITLTNVSVSDEGGYFCQLYTDATHHQVATLSVLVPPDTPTVEVKQEAVEGGVAELTCVSPRSKPAATLRWVRAGREIPGTDWRGGESCRRTVCKHAWLTLWRWNGWKFVDLGLNNEWMDWWMVDWIDRKKGSISVLADIYMHTPFEMCTMTTFLRWKSVCRCMSVCQHSWMKAL